MPAPAFAVEARERLTAFAQCDRTIQTRANANEDWHHLHAGKAWFLGDEIMLKAVTDARR